MTHSNKPEIDFAADYEPGKQPYLDTVRDFVKHRSDGSSEFVYSILKMHGVSAKKIDALMHTPQPKETSAALTAINGAWSVLGMTAKELIIKHVTGNRESALRVFRGPVLLSSVKERVTLGRRKLDADLVKEDGRPDASKENLEAAEFLHRVLPAGLAVIINQLGLTPGGDELSPSIRPPQLEELNPDVLEHSIRIGKNTPELAPYVEGKVKELARQVQTAGDRFTISAVAKTLNIKHALEARGEQFTGLLDQMRAIAANIETVANNKNMGDDDSRELIIRQILQGAKFDELVNEMVQILEESQDHLRRREKELKIGSPQYKELLKRYEMIRIAKMLKVVKGTGSHIERTLKGAFDYLLRPPRD